MARPDAERVWLAFAQHAIGGLMTIDAAIDPTSGRSWVEVNATMCADAAAVADEMLEQWRIRYEEPTAGAKNTADSGGDW